MMVKSNIVFLLLIVVQMLNYVSARRGYKSYDTIEVDDDIRRPSFGGYGKLRAPGSCDKQVFVTGDQIPGAGIRYKQRIMEINENPVKYQLKDDKKRCVGPIETTVHACDEINKPVKVSFDPVSNTVTVNRDSGEVGWSKGSIDVFQACEQVASRRY